MNPTIRFFRIKEGINTGWYADVPNHTLEENQMVAGADRFLEGIDQLQGGKGEVFISVSPQIDVNSTSFLAKLNMISHNQWGATYVVGGPFAED